MYEKYKDISQKTPQQAAAIVGVVDKSNYLAHTIREIELAILKNHDLHYHIVSYISAARKKAKIYFSDKCCTIQLPCACDEMDDKSVRLILAHELGHLVSRIEKLKNPETLDNRESTPEEEIFAWVFAYHLIDKKSEFHKQDVRREKFIYTTNELRRSLSAIVNSNAPSLHDRIIQAIIAAPDTD